MARKAGKNLKYAFLDSPIGTMLAVADDTALYRLEFLDDTSSIKPGINYYETELGETIAEGFTYQHELVRQQLQEYFEGKRQLFEIQLKPKGTEFQQKVWESLQQIPYGQSRTYSRQSIALGKPKAIRAIAAANGKNKIAIIIPCHRVIGANGSLTGYSGGLWRKKFLLELEQGQARNELAL